MGYSTESMVEVLGSCLDCADGPFGGWGVVDSKKQVVYCEWKREVISHRP